MEDENSMIRNERAEYFSYADFAVKLKKSKNILILADNAGEIVFDRILIETIKKMYPDRNITVAMRGSPVLNDALIEDAVYCGLESCASIISSGSNIPGTLLSQCTKEFIEHHNDAELIISKGQGNYESFESPRKDVFYLFMAKCPIVARQAGCGIRAINLLYKQGEK